LIVTTLTVIFTCQTHVVSDIIYYYTFYYLKVYCKFVKKNKKKNHQKIKNFGKSWGRKILQHMAAMCCEIFYGENFKKILKKHDFFGNEK